MGEREVEGEPLLHPDKEGDFEGEAHAEGTTVPVAKVVAQDGAKLLLPSAGRFYYFAVELPANTAYNVACDADSEGFFAARLNGLPEGCPLACHAERQS